MQLRAQVLATRPTQVASHEVEQQYASAAQIFATQADLAESQPEVSFVPVVHMLWLQVPVASEHFRLLPIVRSSATQVASHEVEQQYESAAQTLVTTELQLLASAVPDEHLSCAQVPPPPPVTPTPTACHAAVTAAFSVAV